MISVDPIREEKKIQAMKKYLLGSGNLRNYAMIVLGLNTALRISDILDVTWKKIYDFNNDKFREEVHLTEMKTKKSKKLKLNKTATDALNLYFTSLNNPGMDDYVFMSREGENKPITRQMAYEIIKDAADSVGIKGNIACHSLRKTFGYWSAKKGIPLHILMALYNHSSERTTKLYLGITQDDLNDVYTLIEL